MVIRADFKHTRPAINFDYGQTLIAEQKFDGARGTEAVLRYATRNLKSQGIIMSSTGNLILAIMWIFMSPLWFFSNNAVVGVIWLCGGSLELIIGLMIILFLRR